MKHKPLVSILINNYNYGRFISEAIDSALNQTYPHIEVIVVDDGSTDNSREIINNYKDKIIPVLKDNGGQASAFNAGFAATKGDIICILDADDIALPEKVTEVVNIFREHLDIDWCFHSLKITDIKTGAVLKRVHRDNAYTPITKHKERENLSRKCDFRLHMIKKGKAPFIAPASSGLCFTSSFIKQILPLPVYEAHKTSADRCLTFTAIALSKGFFLDKELTVQRIHGNNAYTAMDGRQQYMARAILIMANWMRAKFPEFTKFTNKSLAKSLSIYWRTGEVEVPAREIIKNYLDSVSPLERLEISLRAYYYSLKL
ncbi:MAG: glycosyltransferase [Scytonema sp. RU_4_4]|nr:glycosyltransferase [Scytonema sp. RU_4_4]NJR74103.1 glycosyltransferase [Scytonema sp. CRU_2_7]